MFAIRPILLVGAAAVGLFAMTFGSGEDEPEVKPVSDASRCEFHVAADLLNVRSGPGAEHKIMAKLRKDAVTGAQGEIKNGFRKLADDRWAAMEFLKPDSRNTCQ